MAIALVLYIGFKFGLGLRINVGEGEEQTVNSQPSRLTCFQKVNLELREREREIDNING
jgi:hypothetical protein